MSHLQQQDYFTLENIEESHLAYYKVFNFPFYERVKCKWESTQYPSVKKPLQISSNIGSWYKLYRTIIRLKARASDLCLDWSQESYSSRIPNSAELNWGLCRGRCDLDLQFYAVLGTFDEDQTFQTASYCFCKRFWIK